MAKPLHTCRLLTKAAYYLVGFLLVLLSDGIDGIVQMPFPRDSDVIHATSCRFDGSADNNEYQAKRSSLCIYKVPVSIWWSKDSTNDEACLHLDPSVSRYKLRFSGNYESDISCETFNTGTDGALSDHILTFKIAWGVSVMQFHFDLLDLLSQQIVEKKSVILLLADPPPKSQESKTNLLRSGLQKCPLSGHKQACNLDFIEIGTSNFDTAAQKLVELEVTDNNTATTRAAGIGKGTAGISIEPVIDYLNQLPDSDALVKVNAAITTNKLNSISNYNNEAIVFYIPESTLIKLDGRNWMKGCTAVGRVHMEIFYLINRHNLRAEIIQRKAVPAITMEALLHDVHFTAGINRIRLLKLDVEGMDLDLVEATLDFFEGSITDTPNDGGKGISIDVTGASSISGGVTDTVLLSPMSRLQLRAPCIISFETSWGKGHNGWGFQAHDGEVDESRANGLYLRFKQLGYLLTYESLDSLGSMSYTPKEMQNVLKYLSENSMAINCACPYEDIYRAGMFLDSLDPNLSIRFCQNSGKM